MKRPPNRKLVIGALVLLAAAGALVPKPEAGDAGRNGAGAPAARALLSTQALRSQRGS